MYGGIPEKKLTEKDMRLNCQSIRDEFEKEINIEHQRINVDSAKKKAVLYHHDYEGFRQMVLGANLYSIKSKELANFGFNETNNEKIFNSSYQKQQQPSQEEIKQLQINIKEIQCKNFRDFRTLFSKHYNKPLSQDNYAELMNILQMQSEENIKKIFSVDFHIEYFFKILEVFDYSISILKDGKELSFMIGFLGELVKIKDFIQQIKKFLKKQEKEELREFFGKLKQSLTMEYQQIELNELIHKKYDELIIQYL
ncbi:unnamed protein product [Paramecium sonneborni]|uniref:Dynein attachment factor N-terminal domain-containing protein n=1 Tax=Paramecium sonneborni TaxID=65129 RepID=A0A8S1M1U9_9CILI|nr:unnamed protein product [Paramecium sonneborni]